MNVRTLIRFCCLALVAAAASACSGSGTATAAKTEALPADGGELGKAFAELTAALAAGDKTRAGKLLDPQLWHMDNKEPAFLVELYKQIQDYAPTGGRRQGDYATLFVANKQPYYAMVNATHTADGWRFDSPLPTGSSVNSKGRDCATSGKQFPCGVTSAPDSQVSGRIKSPGKSAPAVVLIDGIAVRMLDGATKALKSTTLMLSGKGINPQMVALSYDLEEVQGWLNYPLLRLDLAPDGKSAKAEYFDGMARKHFDVGDGLTIDAGTPNRIRGQLKTDVKDAAEFNIAFDIAATSECVAGGYQCGGD